MPRPSLATANEDAHRPFQGGAESVCIIYALRNLSTLVVDTGLGSRALRLGALVVFLRRSDFVGRGCALGPFLDFEVSEAESLGVGRFSSPFTGARVELGNET